MATETRDSSPIAPMRGSAWKFGDNVPTDQIVPTAVVQGSMDVILPHVLAELKPEFPRSVKPGDILVAGHHFGQSSGRGVASKAIRAAGISVIVAESFARTFLRNSYEVGLPIIECPGCSELAKDGDIVSVDIVKGVVRNETTDVTLQARPVEPFLLTMLEAGGIIPLVKKTGPDLGFKNAGSAPQCTARSVSRSRTAAPCGGSS
jgi:3-isopropylmalate/(R)-2-methylmalate dehydratase small subunit